MPLCSGATAEILTTEIRLGFQQKAFSTNTIERKCNCIASISVALVDKYAFNDPYYLMTELESVASTNIDVCFVFRLFFGNFHV